MPRSWMMSDRPRCRLAGQATQLTSGDTRPAQTSTARFESQATLLKTAGYKRYGHSKQTFLGFASLLMRPPLVFDGRSMLSKKGATPHEPDRIRVHRPPRDHRGEGDGARHPAPGD